MELFTACALGAAILLIYHYLSQKYLYFLTKPVPCDKPTFLFGNVKDMLLRRKDAPTIVKKIYNSFPGEKIIGFYNIFQPIYLLRDPEVIKQICVKDFDNFTDHTPMFSADSTNEQSTKKSLFGNALFALRGRKWRDMRSTLSPAFTGSKMRHMFELVAQSGVSFKEFLLREAHGGKRLEFDMKDMFSRFGSDVIATVAFGMEVNCMRDPESEFYMNGKKLIDLSSVKALLKFVTMRAMPRLAERLDLDLLDGDATTYFKNVIAGHIQQREAHGITRNDMISMLMKVQKGALKHQAEEQDTKDAGFATVEESSVGKTTHSRVWTEDELVAQCFQFFFAGFDTLSSCLTFLFYELALNPDIQTRLYEEVAQTDRSLNGSPLSYETLQKMEYMDMVVSEALRKWPPAILTDRRCTADYHYNDGVGTTFTIEKGVTIWIPIINIHNDHKYYPNPERFDPERFNEENRSNITPGTYLPFGVGPRNCIGSRFALMEVKSITYYLLREFSIETTAKTEIPIQLARVALSLQGQNGVWLELKPRKS